MTSADWTKGEAGLAFQRCPACREAWGFERRFCPACGDEKSEMRSAAGTGIIYSVTRVERAPTPELKGLAPYTIVLADMTEGFRVMAHGDPTLTIGCAVLATFRDFGGKLVPHFVIAPSKAHLA